jgi:hypothetical protein
MAWFAGKNQKVGIVPTQSTNSDRTPDRHGEHGCSMRMAIQLYLATRLAFPDANSVSTQQACYSDVDGHSRE